MTNFNELHKLLYEASEVLAKAAYTEGGVGSVAGFADQVGSPSAEVLLTDKKKKKDRLTKAVKPAPDVKDPKTEGIKTTSNGKRIPVTGLSAKKKDEYLFGDTKIDK